MKFATILLLLGVFLAPASRAEAPSIPCSEYLVQTEGGQAVIALRFDLSGVRPGTLSMAENYLLEWALGSLGTSERFVLELYEAPGGWTNLGFVGSEPDLSDAKHLDTWVVDPVHAAKVGQGYARLDLSGVGKSWASESTPNTSVLVLAPNAKKSELKALIGSARLVIY